MTEEQNPWISFEEALEKANKFAIDYPEYKDKNLLIGNGFSIDAGCYFSYEELLEQANFAPEIKAIFDEFKTCDFEQIIHKIFNASRVVKNYPNDKYEDVLKNDGDLIRNKLIETIHENHPEGTAFLGYAKVFSCLRFLSNFNKLYTLNYDLLLYWVLNSKKDYKEYFSDDVITQFDGFRLGNLGSLVWSREGAEERGAKQIIYYLHGALHLIETESNTYKIRRTENESIIEIIQNFLDNKRFPLVVAEGESYDKLKKIMRNNYLRYCLDSIQYTKGVFFVHGHSLDDNDRHIFNKIKFNEAIKELYIGVFNPEKNIDQVYERVMGIFGARVRNDKLKIYFYDSATANIWSSISEKEIEQRQVEIRQQKHKEDFPYLYEPEKYVEFWDGINKIANKD